MLNSGRKFRASHDKKKKNSKQDTNQDRTQIQCHPQGAISSCAFCKALPPFPLWKNIYSSN
jgi:hypothetical protein